MSNAADHQQPASPGDIASFLASPWLWLTIVVTGVLAFKTWDAEVAAIYALTPEWFTPIGAIISAIGFVTTALVLSRHPLAPLAFFALACLFFLPATLFTVFQGIGAADLPFSASVKAVWGAIFVAAPWVSAVAALADIDTATRMRPDATKKKEIE